MTQSTNILQELNELVSSLTDVASQNVYTVPEGYFDRLIVELMNRIKASEAKNPTEEVSYLSPMLQDISKQMPYSVPTDYFEGLEEKLMQSIRDSSDYRDAKEELEAIVRRQGFDNLKEVEESVLETNGTVTVVAKPLTQENPHLAHLKQIQAQLDQLTAQQQKLLERLQQTGQA